MSYQPLQQKIRIYFIKQVALCNLFLYQTLLAYSTYRDLLKSRFHGFHGNHRKHQFLQSP